MKGSDIISENLESITKTIIVLKYLNQGRTIQFNGMTCKLGETIDGGFTLVYLADKERDEWFGFLGGIDFQTFSEWCNKLTDQEITGMIADMSLKEINKRDKTLF